MGYKNRELEMKLLALDVKGLQTMVDRVEKAVLEICKDPDIIVGNAADLYWHAPKTSDADFVRLRRNSGTSNQGQITVKATDRGDNIDRVEIDSPQEDYKQSKALMLVLMGPPVADVTKKYHVYFLENADTTISVYQVRDDDRVFVEIEARNKRRLKQLVQAIVAGSATEYEWIRSSVYNIFVEKKQMVRESVTKFLEGA